ncbi:hypothetical protein SUGI_0686020 [Cryptomeria japonica]|nr:hypothetical protein SUGI_0686020 [Cryptomeria japonica]
MARENSAVLKENNENLVDRRIGNYHPNVWEDDFLQSLSSPYEASSYREKVESLIEEIKEKALNPLFGDGEKWPSPYDLLERHWNDESGISWGSKNSIADLNTTALGFRVLRLNGYHVSQEVFKIFCDGNGQFVLRPPSEEGDNQLRSVLSLYRAAEISFPGETIMEQAKSFASRYLEQTLAESHNIREKSQLLTEVEYFKNTSWRSRNPRWEAWNSIQIFRRDIDSWMSIEGVYRMSNEICKNILEAAILDFNILQAQHQNELKIISKWWTESSVKEFNFFRHRHVEYYLGYACGLYEFEFSLTRVGYAKLGVMVTLIDDIFDTYGTIDELVHFKTALIKNKKVK